MDAFYERLLVRAATFDELLSDDFEPLPGEKTEAGLAGARLAAWCRSCASGDWSLFDRRASPRWISFWRSTSEICYGSPQIVSLAAPMGRRCRLDYGGIAKFGTNSYWQSRASCVRSSICSGHW